jgi:uncharacterized membrane protein YhaH (DUF805 family)
MSIDPPALPVPVGEGWHPDPAGRHQHRYHDGSSWTDHVADNGQAAQDPLTATAIPEPPAASLSGPGAAEIGADAPTWPASGGAYAPPSPDRPPTNATMHPPHGAQATLRGGVTWQEATQRCLSKYVDFSGRAPRSEYWWFYLTVMVAVVVASLMSEALGALVMLGLLLPNLAVSVRRLHDTGKSGWWLLMGLIPLVGPILLIVWLATEGDRQANVYGSPMTI